LTVRVIHKNSLLLNQHNGDDAPQTQFVIYFTVHGFTPFWAPRLGATSLLPSFPSLTKM